MPTTKDAAARLGIDARSVARLCKQGQIKATKHGRDYLIEEAELSRFAALTRPSHRPRKEAKMTKLMRDANGKIMSTEIDGRRYVACNHDLTDRDGEPLAGFCGQLIDVTDYGDNIPDDLDCGITSNHVL